MNSFEASQRCRRGADSSLRARLQPGHCVFKNMSPKTAVERSQPQPDARLPGARRAKDFSPGRKPWVDAAPRRAPGRGERRKTVLSPRFRGFHATIVATQRLRTGLNSYAPTELQQLRLIWVLNCRAVHPPGEHPLLSKCLLARKLDLARASNCRFWGHSE